MGEEVGRAMAISGSQRRLSPRKWRCGPGILGQTRQDPRLRKGQLQPHTSQVPKSRADRLTAAGRRRRELDLSPAWSGEYPAKPGEGGARPRRLPDESRDQLRQALGLVLGRERARFLNPLEPRIREVGRQPLSVLGLEETILA